MNTFGQDMDREPDGASKFPWIYWEGKIKLN